MITDNQEKEIRKLLDGYLMDREQTKLSTLPLFHQIHEKILLPVKGDLPFSIALTNILAYFS